MGGYPKEALLVLQDVKTMSYDVIPFLSQYAYPFFKERRKISLVVASPPCQEFSYRSFPFARCRYLRDNVPPDKTIWEACVRIAKELNAPLVLENVRGAERYMGKAKAHYGSFYLWGDVPAMLPIGRPTKGFQYVNITNRAGKGPLNRKREWRGNSPLKTTFPGECERPIATYKKKVGSEKYRGPAMSAQRDRHHLENGTRMSGRGAAQAGHHGSNARKEWSAKAAMIPPELSEWIGKCFYPVADAASKSTKGEANGEGR